ncbi:MAG: DUF3524 domain-containing protein [Deltaproteobacteria bacterium]|nr:DUF3524 domain-containing protein [Deltaproteobacteria bacterium]
MKKILLLSAYDAGSHRRWRKDLEATFSTYDWNILTLPPRYFNWRIRGNALSWAFSQKDVLTRSYDLIIATSMVDLATLKGLVPSLATVPSIFYFHENQFAYPRRSQQVPWVEPQLVNLYGALSATRIVFNSNYNRQSFVKGLEKMLGSMPDHVPPSISDLLLQKSSVIPVPFVNEIPAQHPVDKAGVNPFTLVWNHRWEYDKAPERLYRALLLLRKTCPSFQIHILGESFHSKPTVFKQLHKDLEGNIGQWGYIPDRREYVRLLHNSHVVISTALHEFQGLSVIEAIAAGCIPALPDRLCYPDFFPADYLYASCMHDEQQEAAELSAYLFDLFQKHARRALPSAPDVSCFTWQKLKNDYAVLIQETMESLE